MDEWDDEDVLLKMVKCGALDISRSRTYQQVAEPNTMSPKSLIKNPIDESSRRAGYHNGKQRNEHAHQQLCLTACVTRAEKGH